MDNDNLVPEASSAPPPEEAKGLGLGWRTIVAIVAVIVIIILSYPFIQQQFGANRGATTSDSPVTQGTLTAPEATAQADPASAKAQFELGNSYVQANQWEQALAAYERTIELDPNYQAAYANMGVVYYQLGQLDLAASQYQKALELDPNDGEVAYNLGALYLQQALSSGEQPDPELLNQAVTQLQHALELTPDLPEPYFTLGVAYNELDQKEEAIQAFETFLERDTGQDPRASQEAQRYLEELRSQ